MLLDNYHFYKRFKKPDLETFENKSISELRRKYFDGLNIPFHYLNTDNQVKLDDSFSYVLIDDANIEIESYSDVLIIENISKKDISVNLKNCYGINKLDYTFNFNRKNGCLIYASNGTMKTSFAKTFLKKSKN